MKSKLKNNVLALTSKLNLEVTDVIADRRSTLALRVQGQDKQMVLKLVNSDDEDGSQLRKKNMLQNEAKVLSQIPELTNHLYVDYGDDSEYGTWLLLRSVDGGEAYAATKEIRNQKPQNNKPLIDIVLEVSRFYNELFQNGYLHGDVQPAHTYLEDGKATIIDWGLSKKVGEDNPLYKGGFVYFVAPEVATHMISGDEDIIEYNAKTEVYSLGATLYMLYAGHLPVDFGASGKGLRKKSLDEKLEKVCENQILSFSDVGAAPFPGLEELLLKSLSGNPNNRFSDPAEFHSHLVQLDQ